MSNRIRVPVGGGNRVRFLLSCQPPVSSRALQAVLGVLLLVLFSPTVLGASPDPDLDRPTLTGRQLETARKIKAEIMSPCCWNGTVDSHNSPIAEQIAADIERRVAAGETEEEIVNRLVAQYGERILARPRASGFGLAFYLVPAFGIAGAGILLALWLRRSPTQEDSREQEPDPGPAGGEGADELEERFEAELRALKET